MQGRGAKISTKIDVIQQLLDEVETLMVGGAMANTFLLAQGREVGESLVEEDRLDTARQILDKAGDRLILPVPDLQMALVAGGDDELYGRLQQARWQTAVHIYNFTHQMPAMMRASDMILCKAGGLIVTEALACGLPLLLVQVLPGQEEGNAEYIVQHGAGELVREPQAVLEAMERWLADDGKVLAARAMNARRIGRPEAAFKIAEIAWNAPEELARAEGTGEE